MTSPLHDPQIRLECLRLATKPGLSPGEAIAAARELLAWVAGAADNPQGPASNAPTAMLAPTSSDKPPKGAASRGK